MIKRLTAISLCLWLAGCFSDQERQVAACQLDSEAFYRGTATSEDIILALENIRTITCMQSHGYEYRALEFDHDKRCPSTQGNLDVNKISATFARCYRPTGWANRSIYAFEMALGR